MKSKYAKLNFPFKLFLASTLFVFFIILPSFTINAQTIKLLKPENNTIIDNYSVNFEWTVQSNEPTNYTQFLLEISKSPDFNNIIFSDNTDKNIFSHLLLSGVYYWRIKAFEPNNNNNFIISESAKFTITSTLDGIIKNIEITDKPTTQNSFFKIKINFNPPKKKFAIEFEVSKSANFENTLVNQLVFNDNAFCLLPEGNYYVRSRIINLTTKEVELWNEPVNIILKDENKTAITQTVDASQKTEVITTTLTQTESPKTYILENNSSPTNNHLTNELSNQLESLKTELKNLKTELKKSDENNSAAITDLTEKLNQFKRKNADNLNELANIMMEMGTEINDTIIVLTNKILELQNSLNALKSEKQNFFIDFYSLKSDFEKVSNNITIKNQQSADDYQKLAAQVSALQNANIQLKENHDKTLKELEIVKLNNADFIQMLKKKDAELQNIITVRAELLDKIAETKNLIADLRAENLLLKKQLEYYNNNEYIKLAEDAKLTADYGNYEAAIQKFQNLMILKPEADEPYYNIALIKYKTNKLSEAEIYIDKAISKNPQNIENKILKIYILNKQNKTETLKNFLLDLSIDELKHPIIKKFVK